MQTYNIGPEAQATWYASSLADVAPWRMISSDACMIVNVAAQSLNNGVCNGCSGTDNHGAYAPTRETGYTVSLPGQGASFYGIANPPGCGNVSIVTVGNVGTTKATYQIWKYTPISSVGPAVVPLLLRGTNGSWALEATDVCPWGLATAGNAVLYNRMSVFNRNVANLFRIKLLSGGPIQVSCGMDTMSGWAGGAVIHSVDGAPMGNEFWLHAVPGRNPAGPSCPNSTFSVTIFAPKKGMVISVVSADGASAAYTTNGGRAGLKGVRNQR
jgi:hypothetical protein